MPHRFIKNTCFSTANSPDISSKIFSSVARNTAGKCHNTSFKMYGSQLQIFPNIYQQISTFLPQTLLKQCPVSSKIPSFHRQIIRRSQNIFFCHHNCPNMSLKVTRIPAVPLKHPAGKCPSVTLKTSSRFMSSSANTGRPLSCQHRLSQLVLSDVIWHTEMLIW